MKTRTKKNLLHSTLASLACASAVMLLSFAAPAQNLFVTCSTNILEITPDGVQTIFATGLIEPSGLAFDGAGDLFATDIRTTLGAGVIYEYTPDGMRSVFASGLDEPTGLAFDSAGNLFLANGERGNILEFINNAGTLSSNAVVFASVLTFPTALAFNSAGTLFVADQAYNNEDGNGYIYEFTNGIASEQGIFASGLDYPDSLAFNSAGDLFETDGNGGVIYEYTPDGTQSIFSFASHPSGLAFDNAGDLFEAVISDGNIYEFTNGVATGQGIFASGLSGPEHLAFSPHPSFSVDINMFAGVILNNGHIGSNYLIQATASLSSSNWATLTNLTLPSQPYIYIDYSSPTNSRQFYRVVPQ